MSTSSNRKPSRVQGANLLITAGTLVAMLAGWASLAWKVSADSAAAAPSLLSAAAQLAAARVALPPIPTLVPGPSQPSVAANPVPAQRVSQPALRNLSAPPAPVTLTQSSRP